MSNLSDVTVHSTTSGESVRRAKPLRRTWYRAPLIAVVTASTLIAGLPMAGQAHAERATTAQATAASTGQQQERRRPAPSIMTDLTPIGYGSELNKGKVTCAGIRVLTIDPRTPQGQQALAAGDDYGLPASLPQAPGVTATGSSTPNGGYSVSLEYDSKQPCKSVGSTRKLQSEEESKAALTGIATFATFFTIYFAALGVYTATFTELYPPGVVLAKPLAACTAGTAAALVSQGINKTTGAKKRGLQIFSACAGAAIFNYGGSKLAGFAQTATSLVISKLRNIGSKIMSASPRLERIVADLRIRFFGYSDAELNAELTPLAFGMASSTP